jgi:phosphoribulokinase
LCTGGHLEADLYVRLRNETLIWCSVSGMVAWMLRSPEKGDKIGYRGELSVRIDTQVESANMHCCILLDMKPILYSAIYRRSTRGSGEKHTHTHTATESCCRS